MSVLREHFYQYVPPMTTVTKDYFVPSGKTAVVGEAGGSAAGDNSSVDISWDPVGVNELIMATHGDARIPVMKSFTGDGSKVLRITLSNPMLNGATIGGWFEGEQSE